MCGIAGILGRFDADPRQAVRAMAAVMKNRGPDDYGELSLETPGGTLALAHRRLSIIDLSQGGHQPMTDPTTRNVVVFNGEIYNYRELKTELAGLGQSFATQSDTEVVLKAYAAWGSQAFARFRGMYAVGLWDQARGRLLLARDHVGIKPLYYAATKHGLVFASEVKAITASRLVDQTIDRAAVASLLAFGSVQSPHTMLSAVRSVAPGTWLECDAGGAVVRAGDHFTWPVPGSAPPSPVGAVIEELRQRLDTSVRRHLVADVPVAVFLSSGLDSTCVAGLARASQRDIRTFTVAFADEPDHNEAALAAATARRFDITHTVCPVTEPTALAWVSQALLAMDLPSIDGLNVYIVSRAAAEHGVKVALSGQGGDEIFGGYPSFEDVPRLHRGLSLAGPLLRAGSGLLSASARPVIGGARAAKLRDLLHTGPDLAALYFHRRRLFSDDQLEVLGITAANAGLQPTFQPIEIDLQRLVLAGEPACSVARLETAFYLHNTLLRDGDVYSMANSVEVRVPMLSRDLMEYQLALPGHVAYPRGKSPKALLRAACKDLYVPALERQRKRGFVVPLNRWIRGPLADTVKTGLDRVRQSGLVDPKGVDATYDLFCKEPESPIWTRLWALVVLGHWLERERATAPGTG
ncbi:MAG: asparagine synthase (glutamine-hydrolyzing) [Deltaproteobacteria bacterium]|nr:asparagine synthase (glutamine-hydrolyzing) [Deltaproteobacteria bacterium]